MRFRSCYWSLLLCLLLSGCDQGSTPPAKAEIVPGEQTVNGLVVPPMPVAVANNAVALIGDSSHFKIYSLLGLLAGKTWHEVTNRAFEYDSLRQSWQEIDPVPGDKGRLAATAQTVAGKVYLFGGYTVAEDGTEVSWPGVYQLDPQTNRYLELAAMPVPVDDTVSAVYQDRFIYLVSGWHDTDNVDNVQVYDTVEDRWSQATPYPGPALFGHAGGLGGNHLVICDGVKVVPLAEEGKRDFVISDQCYQGEIDSRDVTLVKWQPINAHPAAPLYRSAAGTVDGQVVFAGGTGNPYNYNGTGYDSNPSVPVGSVRSFDPAKGEWRILPDLDQASMDHRGLLMLDGKALIVGGMNDAQQVVASVQVYTGVMTQSGLQSR